MLIIMKLIFWAALTYLFQNQYVSTSKWSWLSKGNQSTESKTIYGKNKVANQSKSLLLTEPPLAVNRSSTAMKGSNTYGDWKAKNGTAATESQLVYQWNLLFQTKSVPATKKVGRGRCHLQRSPPVATLSFRHTNTRVHSLDFQPI